MYRIGKRLKKHKKKFLLLIPALLVLLIPAVLLSDFGSNNASIKDNPITTKTSDTPTENKQDTAIKETVPSKPTSTSSKPSNGNTDAQKTQIELERVKKEGADLKRCNDAESYAYPIYTSQREVARLEYSNKTQGLFNDSRIDLNQMKSINEYLKGIFNKKAQSVFATYTNYVRQQNCEPIAKDPVLLPIDNTVVDLLTYYPYLANYPNI